MSVPLIVDSLDTIEESNKALYIETDGKFHLDPDLYRSPKEKLVDAKNKDLLAKLNKAKPFAEKFKDVDDDTWTAFQEYKAKKDEGDPDDEAGKSKDGKLTDDQLRKLTEKSEQRERKLKDTHKAEIEAAKAEKSDVEKRLQSYVRDTTLKDMAIKAGVLPDMLDVFLSYFGGRFRLNESNELIALDEDGEPLDIKPQKFVGETCKELKPRFFAAPADGGSGASGAGNGGSKGHKTIKRAQFDQMNATQRAEHFKSKGQIID